MSKDIWGYKDSFQLESLTLRHFKKKKKPCLSEFEMHLAAQTLSDAHILKKPVF